MMLLWVSKKRFVNLWNSKNMEFFRWNHLDWIKFYWEYLETYSFASAWNWITSISWFIISIICRVVNCLFLIKMKLSLNCRRLSLISATSAVTNKQHPTVKIKNTTKISVVAYTVVNWMKAQHKYPAFDFQSKGYLEGREKEKQFFFICYFDSIKKSTYDAG